MQTRYTVTPPDITVDMLIKQLQEISAMGFGSATPIIYDPNEEIDAPITGFTYGEGQPVKFYADEP